MNAKDKRYLSHTLKMVARRIEDDSNRMMFIGLVQDLAGACYTCSSGGVDNATYVDTIKQVLERKLQVECLSCPKERTNFSIARDNVRECNVSALLSLPV